MSHVARSVPLLLAVVFVALLAGSTVDTSAACVVESQVVFHGLGSFFEGCPDAQPVAGYAYLISDPAGTNSAGQDLVCDTNSGTNGIGMQCQPETGTAGDGRVAILYDWGIGNQGAVGCPNPSGVGNGVTPIAIPVMANDGSGLIVTLGFNQDIQGFLVEQAQPFNGQNADPIACNFANAPALTAPGTATNACVHVPVPRIRSDCDPGTVGVDGYVSTGQQPLCTQGGTTRPTTARGRLYTSQATCSTIPDLRLSSGWTLLASQPDAGGNACNTFPAPGTGICNFIGITGVIGGSETPVIIGTFRAGVDGCLDLDGDGSTGCAGDCNDSDPAIHPGATEICNGVDDNCDGSTDEGFGTITCGAGVCQRTVQACVAAQPGVCVPGTPSPEICNGIDDDCDGLIDDGAACPGACAAPGTSDDGHLIPTAFSIHATPSIVWTGSGIGMVETVGDSPAGGAHVIFRRLDPDGNPIGSIVFLTTDGWGASSLAWTGNEYAAVYADTNGAAGAGIYFARFTAAGSLIGTPSRVPVTGGGFVRLLWTGQDYGLFVGPSPLVFVHLDRNGVPLPGPTVIVRATTEQPTVAWSGHGYAVAWREPIQSAGEIYFMGLNPGGAPTTAEIRLTNDFFPSSYPVLTWTGTEYGLAWLDGRVTGQSRSHLFLTRLAESGMKLSPDTDLNSAFATTPVGAIAMAWAGAQYDFVYREGTTNDLFLSRADATGSRVGSDTRLFNVPGPSYDPAAVWTGVDLRVVFDDGRNGNAQAWFLRIGCDCVDGDGDGVSVCRDCDDTRADVYPGAAEVCDGVDQNCNGLVDEGLGVLTCGVGACRRTVNACVAGTPQVCFPGLPSVEVCNALDDDCNGLVDERDADGDGYTVCADCNDAVVSIHPGAPELCNGIDDNCNSLVDDVAGIVDADGDGIPGACDNCPLAHNPSQLDSDGDARGNSCDNCPLRANPGQADRDFDQRGDLCDNCPDDANTLQDDYDLDGRGDACDNCVFASNADQGDVDHDQQGDVCDLDDGLILVMLPDGFYVEWQKEAGFTTFNVYRGDLKVLRQTGQYTQDPALVPLAYHACGVVEAYVLDGEDPVPGQMLFYLVTGVGPGGESSLGTNSAGQPRTNTHPCP